MNETHSRRRVLVRAGGMLLAMVPLFHLQAAEDARPILVRDGWVAASVGGQKATGAFMVIENRGAEDDALIGAASPMARMVQVHRTVFEKGVGRMVPQERLVIPAGGRVELRHGGHHVMLMGLTRPLRPGDRVPLTLRFEQAGEVELELPVLTPMEGMRRMRGRGG